MKASKAKNIEDLFELHEVRGKRVFVVDDHHKAFAAWAVVRRELDEAPLLISFDHHTDTLEAFLHAAAIKHPYDHDAMETERAKLMATLGWSSDKEVLASVAKLAHDEHIDAAAACGLLRASFSLQLSDMSGTPSVEEETFNNERKERWPLPPQTAKPSPPFTYAPEHNVFVVGHDCFIGCEARPHNDDCLPVHYSQVIESAYVEDQLARAAEMARSIGINGEIESVPYILDVDLDVFHTVASIEPEDAASFYRLIRGAVAITIATEAECVDELWWEDEETKLNADDLLARMLAHIETALS